MGERFIVGGYFNTKHTDWRARLIYPIKGRELRKPLEKQDVIFIDREANTGQLTETRYQTSLSQERSHKIVWK